MAIPDELLQDIASTIGSAVKPSLTTSSAVSDLFEAYTFSIMLRAAIKEGATVEFRDPRDMTTNNFVFRTSPGYIWSQTHPYTFALIEFPNSPPLEAHLGIRVSGKSKVLHELDVCMIRRSEGITCRQNKVHPRCGKVLLGIECKFYTSSLNLGLARAFIGLGTDVTAKNTFFISNTESASVEKLLTANHRKWGNLIYPGSVSKVELVRNEFQSIFKYYKAL